MTSKEKLYGKLVEDKIYFLKRLDFLGIKRIYTGYFMLVDILNLLINEPRRVVSFSKQIYPYVADKYGKTVFTIERNIRNLIDKSWSDALMKKLNVNISNKPKCREFIFIIKNYMLNQIS